MSVTGPSWPSCFYVDTDILGCIHYKNKNITKTYLYNFDLLKPRFCIVKLGLTGVYIGFLISAKKNIDCGYSLELPQCGSSNEFPQSMFWAEMWKISEFLSENFQFLVVKFSTYLNRRVFVMLFFSWCLLCLSLFCTLQTLLLCNCINLLSMKMYVYRFSLETPRLCPDVFINKEIVNICCWKRTPHVELRLDWFQSLFFSYNPVW